MYAFRRNFESGLGYGIAMAASVWAFCSKLPHASAPMGNAGYVIWVGGITMCLVALVMGLRFGVVNGGQDRFHYLFKSLVSPVCILVVSVIAGLAALAGVVTIVAPPGPDGPPLWLTIGGFIYLGSMFFFYTTWPVLAAAFGLVASFLVLRGWPAPNNSFKPTPLRG